MTGRQIEGQVVKACFDWLFLHGVYAWRNNTGAYKDHRGQFIRYGLPGSPDIIGVTQTGRFIGVEAKHGKNKLSDHQIAFKERIEAKGGLYIVAYGVEDLEARKAEIVGNVG